MTFDHLVYKSCLYHIKKYRAILICCMISVAVLFAYSTIYNNSSLMDAFENKHLVILLEVSNAVLAVFTILFVNYTLRKYFTHKRREYAVLQMLGCSKRVTLKHMIIELLVILGFAILLGLLTGVLLSYAFFQIFKHLLDYQRITYQLSIINFLSTTVFFLGLAGMEVLVGSLRISKVSPIELIKKSEKPRRHSFLLLWFVGALSTVHAIVYLYEKSMYPSTLKPNENPMMIGGAFLGFGLLLMIFNLDALILSFKRIFKKFHYKNMVLFALISNNFKESRKLAFTLTLITFLVISLVSTVLSTYLNAVDTTKKTQPYELVFQSIDFNPQSQAGESEWFTDFKQAYDGKKLVHTALKYYEGTHQFSLSSETEQHTVNQSVNVISETSYNALTGLDIHLEPTEYYSHMNDLYRNTRPQFPFDITTLNFGNQKVQLSFTGQERSPIVNMKFLTSHMFIVIDDELFNHAKSNELKRVHLLSLDSWKASDQAVKIMSQKGQHTAMIKVATAIDYLKHYRQETGTRLFIVLFIGCLFILAGIGMQFLKLSTDEEYYRELKDRLAIVGFSERAIKRLFSVESVITLLMPYIIGCILGYVFAVIRSIHSPIHHYFVRDLALFSLIYFMMSFLLFRKLVDKMLRHVFSSNATA